jgi:undecaprenyl-diphosphatase
MPDWLAIVLLGIIEGITEFIPISSTGHLLLAQNWLPRQSDLFNIVIQSAAVLAVLPLFRGRLHQFLFHWRERPTQDLMAKISVAFVLTCVGGFILDQNNFELPETPVPVAVALIAGGVLFVLIERRLRHQTLGGEITWTIALAVGIGQLIAAVFPGVSRSGATIIIALLLGLSRPVATEFSFLVGIPTMLAAGGLKIFKALWGGGAVQEDWSMLLLGSAISAVVSFIAVKWLLRFVQSHTFTGFGWYRIAVGIVVLLLMAG